MEKNPSLREKKFHVTTLIGRRKWCFFFGGGAKVANAPTKTFKKKKKGGKREKIKEKRRKEGKMLLIIFALHTKIIFTPHQQQYCPPPNIRDLALPLIWIFLKLKSAFSLIFILPSCALTKRPTVEGGGGGNRLLKNCLFLWIL